MVIETRGSRPPQSDAREVTAIDGPGKYRIHASGEHLPYFDSRIPGELRKRVPGISTISFHKATLLGGEYTPASLVYQPTWDGGLFGITAQVVNGEVFQIGGNSNSSNGHGNSFFEIKDIGNLSIVRNILKIEKPKGRDGRVTLFASGGVGHFHRWSPEAWDATVNVEGEKLGILVRETMDVLNNWAARYALARGEDGVRMRITKQEPAVQK